MTVTCPQCSLEMLWTLQPERTVVRCPNREITSWIGDPPRQQPAIAIYATTDRKVCWQEAYWVDGEDRVPSWRCREIFAVRAAPTTGTSVPNEGTG